jgi:hypothetical protein
LADVAPLGNVVKSKISFPFRLCVPWAINTGRLGTAAPTSRGNGTHTHITSVLLNLAFFCPASPSLAFSLAGRQRYLQVRDGKIVDSHITILN